MAGWVRIGSAGAWCASADMTRALGALCIRESPAASLRSASGTVSRLSDGTKPSPIHPPAIV